MARPEIDPMPPIADGRRAPVGRTGHRSGRDLGRVRAELGDTFVVDSGPDRYLFTFSPEGVANFYALPEDMASKGVADWRMLRRKVPDELFDGRRTLPHELFGREDVAGYLDNVDRALAATVDELGRRAHRRRVRPHPKTRPPSRTGLVGRPGRRDRRALRNTHRRPRRTRRRRRLRASRRHGRRRGIRQGRRARRARRHRRTDRRRARRATRATNPTTRSSPASRSAGTTNPPDERRQGVAYDVALVHIASMSNLFAALGWALVDLMNHPVEQARVRDGDRARAEQCALESTRLAQRSIMSRYTMAPFDFAVGTANPPRTRPASPSPRSCRSPTRPPRPASTPGIPTAGTERRLADTSQLAAVELVTAFGHGPHTCPPNRSPSPP